MKRIGQYLVVVASMISMWAFHPTFADSEIERARTRLRIESVTDMSYAKPFGPRDDHFWRIVRLGKSALPDLLTLVENWTSTGIAVELFGGNYCIGDIAMLAMMKIIPDIPLVEFVSEPHEPQYIDIGFGVYWNYVRKSHANRMALQARLRYWLSENDSRLQWISWPEHPAGGWYSVGASTGELETSGLTTP